MSYTVIRDGSFYHAQCDNCGVTLWRFDDREEAERIGRMHAERCIRMRILPNLEAVYP